MIKGQEFHSIEQVDEEDLFHLRGQRACWRMVHMMTSIAFVTVLPFVYMKYLQHVIVDYRWDVHEVCMDWVNELDG